MVLSLTDEYEEPGKRNGSASKIGDLMKDIRVERKERMSKIGMQLEKGDVNTIDEWIDVSLQNVELRAINRMLVAACYDALQLRGLMQALQDPLALDSEKHQYRSRWKMIELGIRAAIEKADNVDK